MVHAPRRALTSPVLGQQEIKMTLKDYTLIAGEINTARNLPFNVDQTTVDLLVSYLSDAMEYDNPEFEADKFEAACDVSRNAYVGNRR